MPGKTSITVYNVLLTYQERNLQPTVQQICSVTAMTRDQVLGALQRLKRDGYVGNTVGGGRTPRKWSVMNPEVRSISRANKLRLDSVK